MHKQELFEALYYLKMAELKKICNQLDLPDSPPKGQMIDRIKYFLSTGKILKTQVIPEISKASYFAKPSKDRKKNQHYPLKPDTLMLKGAYKNDAQTRAFFKTLIGDHFHFTAFGIDWLNEHWMQGRPPTYQEFATMWQKEVDKRKHEKPAPKKEWAYITFVQNYMEKHPNASKAEVTTAWNKIRAEKVMYVYGFLKTKY